jgi:hypothetical protein
MKTRDFIVLDKGIRYYFVRNVKRLNALVQSHLRWEELLFIEGYFP